MTPKKTEQPNDGGAGAADLIAWLKNLRVGPPLITYEEISKRVRLRTTPQFNFQLDHSMEQAERVQRTLQELAPELAAANAREAAEAAEAAKSKE